MSAVITLALRYLRSRRIALVCVFTVAMGVMSLIVLVSLMDGVQRFLEEHARRTGGDMTVKSRMTGRGHQPGAWVRDRLKSEMEEKGGAVRAISTRYQTLGLVVPGAKPKPEDEHRVRGVILIGIDFQDERLVSTIGEMIDNVDEESIRVPREARDDPLASDGVPRILLGDSLAREIGVSRIPGARTTDMVTVGSGQLTETQDGKTKIESVQGVFRFAGAFTTGKADYDDTMAFVDRAELRKLLFGAPNRGPDATHIQLSLVDPDAIDDVQRSFLRRFQDLEFESWRAVHDGMLQSIEDQKGILGFILTLVLVVACAAIAGLIYMMVVEKVRDIGVLRSMGFGRWQVVLSFTIYGRFSPVRDRSSASLSSARTMAAQLTPPSWIRPTPAVMPVADGGCRVGGGCGIAARCARELDNALSEGREVGGGQRVVAAFVQCCPRNAELGRSIRDDLNDDGLDQYLGAPDIELVDDGHGRAHHLWRGRQNERIGLRVRPDAHVGQARASACGSATGCAGRSASLLLRKVLLQFGCEFFCVCVAQITNLGVATVFQRRIEVRDQSAQAQALRTLAADQHAVRPRISHELCLQPARHRPAVPASAT